MMFRVSTYFPNKLSAEKYLKSFFGDPPKLNAEVIKYNGRWIVAREATEEEMKDKDFADFVRRGKIYGERRQAK